MNHTKRCSHGETVLDPTCSECLLFVPKPELLDFEVTPEASYSGQLRDHAASSSGGSVRTSLLGMGFLPLLVDKAIEENGERNVDLLVDTLIGLSNHQSPNSLSSDSFDILFDEEDETTPSACSKLVQEKVEPDAVDDEKRASLTMMKFSAKEIEFAIEKLGENAPIYEIVEFIIAAQVDEAIQRKTCTMPSGDAVKMEGSIDEVLYGTMEKTLRLIELGFSDNEISLAIEALGSEVPIGELADWICSYQVGDVYIKKKEHCSSSSCSIIDHSQILGHHSSDTVRIKTENCSHDSILQSQGVSVDETRKGKRKKQGCPENYPDPPLRHSRFEDKRPKEEYNEYSSSYDGDAWMEEKVVPKITTLGLLEAFRPNSRRTLDHVVAKPPYFFYAIVTDAPSDVWKKISQFLYATEPEIVDTRFFSALSRKEGYIHNLPTENRFHILPKAPMTIKDAVPSTKKWWPSWDTREQLTCINYEPSGISQTCDRLARLLVDSRGLLSPGQKSHILHQCEASNLIWVGRNKLAPMEPEGLERVLGYSVDHTRCAEYSLMERLYLLKYCFQTDTLGYHLSGLKSVYPEGMTVLSLFTGIGGAEVALHRTGIRLKGVVSVETSETNRKMFRRWWQSTGQAGQLEQVEGIHMLTSKMIDKLIEKFGGFDFVICQTSFTQSPQVPTFSQSAKAPKVIAGNEHGFDFASFYEFVRVLQRVRGAMDRQNS